MNSSHTKKKNAMKTEITLTRNTWRISSISCKIFNVLNYEKTGNMLIKLQGAVPIDQDVLVPLIWEKNILGN